jgi:hypothetical protein
MEARMEFISVRDLSKSPKLAFDRLAMDGKAVITKKGQPQAILVKVDAASFENALSLLQKLEFLQNLTGMRQTSQRMGNETMTLEEINAEIDAARTKQTQKTQ